MGAVCTRPRNAHLFRRVARRSVLGADFSLSFGESGLLLDDGALLERRCLDCLPSGLRLLLLAFPLGALVEILLVEDGEREHDPLLLVNLDFRRTLLDREEDVAEEGLVRVERLGQVAEVVADEDDDVSARDPEGLTRAVDETLRVRFTIVRGWCTVGEGNGRVADLVDLREGEFPLVTVTAVHG